MLIGGKEMDVTDAIIANYEKHHLDALVCLGGGGTQKNALYLKEKGLNVMTLPKTIDNDVAMTDVTFGFDTAMGIATEAIDRLHSTAHSHHRIVVVEIMGHKAGWLTLGAGIAGGADVILIPEIPYDVDNIAKAIRLRSRSGKRFSIVAVAEGAMSKADAADLRVHLDTATHSGDQPELIPMIVSTCLVQRTEITKAAWSPGLARSLEPTLILPTTGFNWATADRPAPIGNFFVVHALSVTGKIVFVFVHHFARLAPGGLELAYLLQNPLFPAMA